MVVVVVDAVDAVVAVEDMSGSPPGTSLKHCQTGAQKDDKLAGMSCR
jgi:hypothetical protein